MLTIGEEVTWHRCTESDCDKEYKQKSDLTQHRRAVHEGVTYPCPRGCGYRTKRKDALKKHIDRKGCRSDADRPHRCTVAGCSKAYKNKKHLVRHQRMHARTGPARPYLCSVPGCTNAYKNKRNLVGHRRKMHAPAAAHVAEPAPIKEEPVWEEPERSLPELVSLGLGSCQCTILTL